MNVTQRQMQINITNTALAALLLQLLSLRNIWKIRILLAGTSWLLGERLVTVISRHILSSSVYQVIAQILLSLKVDYRLILTAHHAGWYNHKLHFVDEKTERRQGN